MVKAEALSSINTPEGGQDRKSASIDAFFADKSDIVFNICISVGFVKFNSSIPRCFRAENEFVIAVLLTGIFYGIIIRVTASTIIKSEHHLFH
jgi:hypothetical protein